MCDSRAAAAEIKFFYVLKITKTTKDFTTDRKHVQPNLEWWQKIFMKIPTI